MKISTLLAPALALALVVLAACDPGVCSPVEEDSTGAAEDSTTASEPEPEPEPARMGDRCKSAQDCEGGPNLFCIGEPFGYCSKQCSAGFDVDCSDGDRENVAGNWTRFTCETWGGSLEMCAENATQEPYDGNSGTTPI